MKNIDDKYRLWYKVWNEHYVPLVMRGKKWHEQSENLVPGDVVYFKLQESAMSANWRTGKVEKVKVGADGCVRQVTIAYPDASSDNAEDWTHRTVDRPVRNVVKISHIDETTFMDDLNDVHNLAKSLMNPEDVAQNLYTKPKVDVESEPFNELDDPTLDVNEDHNSDVDQQEEPFDDEALNDEEVPQHIPVYVPRKRKKKRTELENLEITLKGWNLATSVYQAMSLTYEATQQDMKDVQMYAVDGCASGNKELVGEGEDEDADREFNFVMKDDHIDELYLL